MEIKRSYFEFGRSVEIERVYFEMGRSVGIKKKSISRWEGLWRQRNISYFELGRSMEIK